MPGTDHHLPDGYMFGDATYTAAPGDPPTPCPYPQTQARANRIPGRAAVMLFSGRGRGGSGNGLHSTTSSGPG